MLWFGCLMLTQCDDNEAEPGIIGIWQCDQLIWENCDDPNLNKNESCQNYKYIFKKDGTWLFESATGVGEGTYLFSGNLFSLTMGDQSSEDIVISVSGNTMTTVYQDSVTGCNEKNILTKQ